MSSATFKTRADRGAGEGPPKARPPGLPDGGKAACLGRWGRVCCEAGAVSSICRAACTPVSLHMAARRLVRNSVRCARC